MKKKLVETFAFRASIPQESTIDVDNLITQWGSVSRPELSVYLVYLRFVRDVAHQAHWLAKSSSFVGDHDLLNEIYTESCKHFDSVGERVIMWSNDPRSVDLKLQLTQSYKLIQKNASSLVDVNSDVMGQVMSAEKKFLFASDILVKRLKESGLLSRGVDNLLAGIEDTHEQFVYKLGRRLQ